MSHCVSCDRLFKDEKALKQHQKDSWKHAKPFFCKVCNRSFGTADALNQHQNDKQHKGDTPTHQRVLEVPVAIPSTVVSVPDQVIPLSLTHLYARARDRKNRQSRQATPNDIWTPNLPQTLNLKSMILENQARVFASSILYPSFAPSGVARATVPMRKRETRTSFKFPELHKSVAEAVASSITSTWFHDDDDGRSSDNEHSSCVMGTFTCDNTACIKNCWSSKVVAILIKGYARNGYTAIVFNQRCRLCDRLGDFKLDENSYVERVAYRLKEWAGVMVARPSFERRRGPPHEKEVCEGCKAGVCPHTVDIMSR